MSDKERDTHFQGFAKLLMQEMFDLHERGYIDVSDDLLDEDRIDEYRALIAQRAYDLVYHTLSNTTQGMAAECEHRPAIPENVQAIPDLTEWPPSD